MQYQMEDMTVYDIQRASSSGLRSCLKEDISPETHDIITKELYVREQRRPIVDSSHLCVTLFPA